MWTGERPAESGTATAGAGTIRSPDFSIFVMAKGEASSFLKTNEGSVSGVNAVLFVEAVVYGKKIWGMLESGMASLCPKVTLAFGFASIRSAHRYAGRQFTSLYCHLSAAVRFLPYDGEYPEFLPDLSIWYMNIAPSRTLFLSRRCIFHRLRFPTTL